MEIGRTERYLINQIRKNGAIHIVLIDPEKVTSSAASKIARDAVTSGSSAIMLGGSTFTSTMHLEKVIKAIKRTTRVPVILFPNNITGISRYADAIWFMSLLNSTDPYFLIGAHVLGAPLIKRFKLEPISMGYIIVGEGGTAGIIGRATPIPYDKPELAALHALAAEYLGMHFIYLEAGSGAKLPVPPKMITAVRKTITLPLIVGGGIRSGENAKKAVEAGADIVVTGNVVEGSDVKARIGEIVEGIRVGVRNRK